MKLLTNLQNYDITSVRSEMSRKAKAKIKELKRASGNLDGPELITFLKTKSKSAAGLFKWASATDKYYDIFRLVEPKKKLAEDMQK